MVELRSPQRRYPIAVPTLRKHQVRAREVRSQILSQLVLIITDDQRRLVLTEPLVAKMRLGHVIGTGNALGQPAPGRQQHPRQSGGHRQSVR